MHGRLLLRQPTAVHYKKLAVWSTASRGVASCCNICDRVGYCIAHEVCVVFLLFTELLAWSLSVD